MGLSNDDEFHKDPFEISPEDMANAEPTFNVIDIDEDWGYRHRLIYNLHIIIVLSTLSLKKCFMKIRNCSFLLTPWAIYIENL